MYCMSCGREIPDGSKFCPVCGTKLNAFEEKDDEGSVCQMIFNFTMKTNNENNISVVNEWLNEHQIKIKSLSLTTAVGDYGILIKHETIFMRCEVNYKKQKAEFPYKYQMGYISKGFDSFSIADFEILDKEFDDWKAQNPGNKIVWTYHAVHRYEDFFVYLTLFYVYMVKSYN